jgi:hypothetical protein
MMSNGRGCSASLSAVPRPTTRCSRTGLTAPLVFRTGGKPGRMYPFIIMPGPHGYMIQLFGLTERAAINKEYEEMLTRLCKIKEVWRLSKPTAQKSIIDQLK